MHLRSHLRILATTAALAATGCPAAYAKPIGEGVTGFVPASNQKIPQPHHSSSTDWALIALAGGGTVVLVGAGLGGSRRFSRRRAATRPAGSPHVA